MSLKRRFAQQDELGRFSTYEVTGPFTTRWTCHPERSRRSARRQAAARPMPHWRTVLYRPAAAAAHVSRHPSRTHAIHQHAGARQLRCQQPRERVQRCLGRAVAWRTPPHLGQAACAAAHVDDAALVALPHTRRERLRRGLGTEQVGLDMSGGPGPGRHRMPPDPCPRMGGGPQARILALVQSARAGRAAKPARPPCRGAPAWVHLSIAPPPRPVSRLARPAAVAGWARSSSSRRR